jgi:nitronate monooxygenase
MLDLKERKADPWEMMKQSEGRFRKAFDEGDLEWGSIGCGQVCGLMKDIPTCKDLIERIVQEAEEQIDVVRQKF